jgi:hypothetical protein
VAARACRRLPGIALAVALASLAACDAGDDPARDDRRAAAATAPAPPAVTLTVGPAERPLGDDDARAVLAALVDDGGGARAAIERVLTAADRRFIGPLIELLWTSHLEFVREVDPTLVEQALGALSGQHFAGDWNAWVEWYGAQRIEPPPGFRSWKARLLARVDPGFGEFLHERHAARLRIEELAWGGVEVDAIPALDRPRMVPAAGGAAQLDGNEPVFGVAINGDVRAYPLRYLDWHEMANDVVGGVPVSLAYCTLCGAGVLFDTRIAGTTHTFGSSGLLYRSNKLMYDRQTRTLWNQLTGEPVIGPLAAQRPDGSVPRLRVLPIVVASWNDWTRAHPETLVMHHETGHSRPYDVGAAYGHYFSSPRTMFPVWQRSRALPDKERVYALRLGDVPKAYPVTALARAGVVNDTLGGADLVLVATRGTLTVQGQSLRQGPVEYAGGAEVRAFERHGHSFTRTADADRLLDEQGRSWRVTEQALAGPAGEQLPRLPGHLAYWFGWFAFFPQTLLYAPSE